MITYDPENVLCYHTDAGLDGTYQGVDCQCNVTSTDVDACESAGESTCANIASNCSLVYGLFPTMADIDSNGDGEMDSISAGFSFEAAGAHITGVSP